MMLKFNGYGDKTAYINSQFVTSIELSNYPHREKQLTLVYMINKPDPIVLEDDIEEVVRQIEEAMEPLIWIPEPEDK